MVPSPQGPRGQRGNHRGGHNGHNRGNYYGGYYYGGYVYPYAYTYPMAVAPEPEYVAPEYVNEEPAQPERPALTVFDRGSNVRPAPNPTPVGEETASQAKEAAQSENREQESRAGAGFAEPEPIPLLVIYKDGREKEIRNFAIVGDTLYEIGTYTSHKIKLAELDLKKTVQKNEERGVEFTLPAGYVPEA